MEPTSAATNCKRTPPRIGSIVADERLIHKLYSAYENAHANAGPNHDLNGGGATPAAAATAPPLRTAKVDDTLHDDNAVDNERNYNEL